MRLTKSLAELDAAADELLAKSKAAEEESADEEKEEEVKPEEVSEEATSDEKEEAEETEDKEETVEKSEESDELSEEEDEKSEETEDSDEDEDEEEGTAEDVQKSFQEDFEADETIQKGVGDSEFNAAVIEILAKALGDMQYDIHRSGKTQGAATDILAKSLQAVMQTNQRLQADNDKLTRRINKLEKSITHGFERVMDSLDEISSQPASMRKSVASIAVHDRDFGQSLNGHKTVTGFESLSKAQVLGVLNAELYAGNQNVTPSDIISYESGAPLREDLKALVSNKCR